MGKFKKGLFMGSVLGAGLMWLMGTKKGKEVRDQLLDHAARMYEDLREDILSSDAYKNMTKNKYTALVKEKVDNYIDEHPALEDLKDTAVKMLVAQWNGLKEDIEEKVGKGKKKTKKKRSKKK